MTESIFSEIRGFSSLGEYNRFVEYLERQKENNTVREISPDLSYGKGEIYGGRWFKEIDTDLIWRLIEPDPPFYGLWEQVK